MVVMEQRIREIDYTRAICAMAVIVIHVSAGYVEYSDAAYYLNQTSRFAVPMFIILSGFSILLSDKNKSLSAGSFIKKRFGKILIPYLFWSLFYFTFVNRHGFTTTDPSSLLSTLGKQLYTGTAYIHLYFLVIMFQLYFMYPFLKKWIVEKPMVMLSASFIISFGMHLMIYLHALQIAALPSIGVPYVILFPVWIFYFVLGAYIAINKETILQKIRDMSLVKLLLVWSCTWLILIMESNATQTYTSSTKPSTMLYTLFSFIFFYKCMTYFMKIGSKASVILQWYSVHSFFIYLIHPFVLSALAIATPSIWATKMGLWLQLLCTFLLSTAITHLCSRFRLVQTIGGVYHNPSERKKRRATMEA